MLRDLLPELRNDFDVQGLGDYGGPEVQPTGTHAMPHAAATCPAAGVLLVAVSQQYPGSTLAVRQPRRRDPPIVRCCI